jgi:hypothetical protein
MQKSYLYFTVGLLVSIIAFTNSCKKVDGVDNNNVIETPYALYFSDTSGTLYKSNDGVTYQKCFSSDGYPCRALITAGDNVLWAKTNLYYSNNNGFNFNQAFDSLQFAANIAPWLTTAENGFHIDLNQSMIVNVPGSPGFVYACSDVLHDPAMSSSDYLGVEYNNNNGQDGNWSPDNGYDTTFGHAGLMPVQMISFVLMPSGTLLGLALNPNYPSTVPGVPGAIDELHFRNFYNTNPTNPASNWTECTANNGGGAILSQYSTTDTGNALPPNIYSPNDTCFFTLGAYNARAIAIDQRGVAGAWYSDDNGRTWAQYTGLPANTPLLCIASPFNQVCMIGTQAKGLYILNVNTGIWQSSNSGLTNNLVIRGIAGKENIYKNGKNVMYIYLATNQGIFQSADMGLHWVKTISGNFVSAY